MTKIFAQCLAVMLMLGAPFAMPAAQQHASETVEHPSEAGTGETAEGGHERHNDLALFLGVTAEGSEKEATFGLEYEHRALPWFGFGGLVDYARGDIRTSILAPAAYFHPYRELKLIAAAGVEYLDEEDDTELVVRVGVAWDFEIGERWLVAPAVNLDLIDGEEVWVYGVNLGIRF